MQDFTVGIFPYQDYNKTVYCYESAIQDKQIKNCTNITGMYPYEYFAVFLLQVYFMFKIIKEKTFTGIKIHADSLKHIRLHSGA
jgi:hypothetical protein